MGTAATASPPESRTKNVGPHPVIDMMTLHIWSFILPFVSIAGSITWSILFHFDDVTETHCHVPNVLPTISAAVGNNAPEKYMFRFGIGTYTTVKLILDFTIYWMLQALREHKKKTHGKLPYSQASFEFWNRMSLILVVIEDLLLCTLTMISSTDDTMIHSLAFSGFMICAHLHFITCLLTNKRARSPFTEDEKRWYRARIVFALIHTATFMLAIYLYIRHNSYCEPYIYSIFALCEYIVVAMNVCFHGTGLFEWRHLKYVIRDHNFSGKDE
jgi:hypothetical protein